MRQGIGRMLVLDARAIARNHGVRSIEVTANPAALAFYEALGFRFSHLVSTQFIEAPRLCIDIA